MYNSNLHLGNNAFRNGNYEQARKYYQKAICKHEILNHISRFNISLCNQRLGMVNVDDISSSVFIEKLQNSVVDLDSIKQQIQSWENKSVKQEKLLVSIVMPTWNRADIILEAIRSIQEQSYNNWELIVCDDGGEDETEFLVKSIDDHRIKYFKLQKNNGAVARNHAIKYATGDIIAFLDSDNIWHHDYLTSIIKAHSVSKSPVVYTGYIDAVVENDSIVDYELKFKKFQFSSLSWRNYIDLNTLSFRRNVLNEVGVFDPKLQRQQDWDLIIRLASKFNFYGLNLPLVLYRRNKEWNQVTDTMKHINTRNIVLNKNKGIIKNYSENSNINMEMYRSKAVSRVKTIAIKISAPSREVADSWGDLHFANQLGEALYKFGWNYQVHCQDEWYSHEADINLVIRGRHRFDIKKSNAKLNLLWLISHPDRVPSDEYNDYDHIFIASDYYVNKVQRITNKPVSSLLQAVDLNVFNDTVSKVALPKPVIFVGNSRKVYRPIVKWAIDSGVDFAVWGKDWEEYIDKKYIYGEYIPNSVVSSYYHSSLILLNDHWESMANNGFISNRIFDASASGSFIISDYVRGMENVFGDSIVVARSQQQFSELIDLYLNNDELRLEKIDKAKNIVKNHHTFLHRAEVIDCIVESLISKSGIL